MVGALSTERVPVQAESDTAAAKSEAEMQLAECRNEAAAARQQCEEAAAKDLAKAAATIAELVQQGQQAADEADSMRKNLQHAEERAAAAAEEHEVRACVLQCEEAMRGRCRLHMACLAASRRHVRCRLCSVKVQLSMIAWWLRLVRPRLLLRMKLQIVKQACSCSCSMRHPPCTQHKRHNVLL